MKLTSGILIAIALLLIYLSLTGKVKPVGTLLLQYLTTKVQ